MCSFTSNHVSKLLLKPPFNQPQSFIKLFDGAKQKKLVDAVRIMGV